MKPIHNRIAQKFFLSCILFVFAAIAPLRAQDGWTYTCDNTLPTLSQVMVDACGSGEWRNEFIILKTRDSSFDIRKLRLRSFNPTTNGTAGSITNAFKVPSTETNHVIDTLNQLVNTCSNYGTAFVEVAASPFNGIVPPYSTILLFNNIPDLNGLNINTFAPLCGSRIFVAFGNYSNQNGSLFINNQPGGNCPSGCFRRLNISFTGNLADTCAKYTYDMSRLPRPAGGNPYTGYGEGSYYRPLPDGTLGYGGGMMNGNLCMTDSAMQCVIPSISSTFLTNKWRVNVYSGAPNVSVPRGYYEVENADASAPLSTLNVSSVIGANFNFAFEFNANRHFPANRPPSDAFGGGTSGITRPYEGCLVDNNNFNLTALRTGFSCGYYKIYLANGSDRIRIKIENSNNDITYDQTENNLTTGVIWEGVLNENSRITMTLYKNTDDNDNFSAHIGFYKRDIGLNISPNTKLLCNNEQGTFTATLTPNINNAVINWSSTETGLQSNSGASVNYIRPPSVVSATLSASYEFCPSITNTAEVNSLTSLTPSYGNNFWNVLGFNSTNFTNYRGYYEANQHNSGTSGIPSNLGGSNFAFEFNTGRDGWGANQSPMNAAAPNARRTYEGCTIGNDNFSIRAKRRGFTCGYYRIYCQWFDDAVTLKIDQDGNGTTDFTVTPTTGQRFSQIWEGFLGTNSTIDIEGVEYLGDFNIHLGFYRSDVQIQATPSSATLCAGEAMTLNATNGINYSWSPDTNLNMSTGSTVTATPSVSRIYTVIAAIGGCNYTAQSNITVIPRPAQPNFGNGVWNILGFNGSNNFTNEAYRGYYVQRGDHDWNNGNFEFNPVRDGWADISSPSSANVAGGATRNWEGCSVTNDNFSIYAKRKSFPCGRYYVKIQSLDDGGRIKIDQNGDGIAEFEQNFGLTYSTDIWNGILGDSSKMEIWAYDNSANFSSHLEFYYVPIAKDTTRKDSIVCHLGQVRMFTRMFKNRYGCDSVVITNAQFGRVDTTNLPILSRCNPNDTATITTRLQNIFGCDSIVIQRFTLSEKDTTRFDSLSCDPLSIGVRTRIFINRYGCDSVVLVNVILARKDTTILAVQIRCNPNDTATITTRFQNIFGCDSIVIQRFTLARKDTTNLPILSRCNPSDTATITRRLQNIFDCDSIVIQRFTLARKDTTNLPILSRCNPSDTATITRRLQNIFDCDSIVIQRFTLARKDTTILPTQSRCNPNDTATITTRLQNIFGCDSIVIQRFTLARKDTTILPTQSRCNPNDTTTITTRLQNIFGCDSIVIQRFTLARKDTTILAVQIRCNPNDTATITTRLQNIFGCDSIVIQRFTLVPADISFSMRVLRGPTCAYDETGDLEMTQPIGASPPFSIVWQQGTRDSLILRNRRAGVYRVTVTDAQGCQHSDSVRVVAKFPLNIVSEVTNPVCYGSKGTLMIQTISGGIPPIYWQLNNQNVQRWQNNILVFNGLQVERHILKLSDANGCQRADTFFITEPPRLNITFEASQIRIKEKDTVRLLPRLNFVPQSLIWLPPTDLNCNNCLTPLATPTQSRTYRLTARNAAGCEVSSNISVIMEKMRRVYPPSSFTPNGDGKNDFFTIFSDIDVEKIKILQIYNRWGIKVFEKENFQTNIETEGWDGTLNGVSLPPDVYVYYFIVVFKDGEEVIYQGDITILK